MNRRQTGKIHPQKMSRRVEVECSRTLLEKRSPRATFLQDEGGTERSAVSHAYEIAKGHFVDEFTGRNLATITGPELVEHVEKVTGGPTSFNHRARLIRSFWRWCAREPRAWWKTTVVEHIDPKETVLPANWSRKEKAVRRLAGWRVWSDLVTQLDLRPYLEAKPPRDLPKWPDNALRHTHASVAIAIGQPLDKLMFSGGVVAAPDEDL